MENGWLKAESIPLRDGFTGQEMTMVVAGAWSWADAFYRCDGRCIKMGTGLDRHRRNVLERNPDLDELYEKVDGLQCWLLQILIAEGVCFFYT